jgi:Viral BACON domain
VFEIIYEEEKNGMADNSGSQITIVTTSGDAGVTYQLSNVERTEYPCSECGSTIVAFEGGVNDYLQGSGDNNVYVFSLVRSCQAFHVELGIPDHIGGPKIPVVSPQRLDFGTLKQGSTSSLQMVIVNTNLGMPINWSAGVGVATWLTLDVHNGTIQPGNNQTIKLTANTATLLPGNYPATLVITSNTGIAFSQILLAVN